MKKYIAKILISLFLCLFTIMNGFCADIDFSHSFIYDSADFLDTIIESQLADVLKNLHKETGNDVVVITLNSLGEGETYSDIEKYVQSKYILGGENKDKWAMVILTQNPYKMHIRVGKGLKRVIPNSMKRALGLEFWSNKFLHNLTSNNNTGSNLETVVRNAKQINLYTTVLLIAEAIADDNGARLHTSDIVYDIYGLGDLRERGVYIPQSSEVMKFIRRHNLYPVIIILFIGIFPYTLRRRRRGLFGFYGRRQRNFRRFDI